MSTENIANKFAEQQGWTDATLLDLCLTYIGRQQDDAGFEDYLNSVAADETDDSDEALHDAADEFASSLADYGIEAQVAFLKRSGEPRAAIEEILAESDAEALDEHVRDLCHNSAADAANNGMTTEWLRTELGRHHFIENIESLVVRKQAGQGSTEEESADVKAYLRPRMALVSYDEAGVCTVPSGLLLSVVETFPVEWDEVFDEDEVTRASNISARPEADLTPGEAEGSTQG